MNHNKTRTGIIGAMETEIQLLKEAMIIEDTQEFSSMRFYLGRIGNRDIALVQSGMGKVNAAICAHTLIREFNAKEVINTGVAGSLNNILNIGDIVISADAVQHDFDVSPIGFAKGEIPYTGLFAFPADEGLRAKAKKAAESLHEDIQILEGRICSGDQFIASKDQKKRITEQFGGYCAEMEGAAIAQACYINSIPYVIIRAISDKADESSEIPFEQFAPSAAARCAAIVKHMLENGE